MVAMKTENPRQIPYSIDELVKRIIENEQFDVGDYIDFALYTGELVRAYIIGKNHDLMENGEFANYTFGIPFIDYEFKMNDTAMNQASWAESKMRNIYLPRIYMLFPTPLRENITPVKKLTAKGGNDKNIVASMDKIFCFSGIEVYGQNTISSEAEGKQYEFYKEKKNRNIPNYPWLRSPYHNNSNAYCCIFHESCGFYDHANNSHGVAFGFCLSAQMH